MPPKAATPGGDQMNNGLDFDDVLGKINEELSSARRLYPVTRPGHGVEVITGPELIPGWIGIIYDDGRQAFGPAPEILVQVKSYARKLLENKSILSFRSTSRLKATALPDNFATGSTSIGGSRTVDSCMPACSYGVPILISPCPGSFARSAARSSR
jgi:hypothetical protein